MTEIKSNLKLGIRKNDLYIDNDIASEVRGLISKEIEGKNFYWGVVRRGNNPYTGKPESFTGEVIGNERHYLLINND